MLRARAVREALAKLDLFVVSDNVLSNDSINHFAELAVVVPLTTNTARVSPSHTLIPRGTAGLKLPSKAVTEQIRAVDKRRLVKKLGHLAPELLAQVERALKNTLALP